MLFRLALLVVCLIPYRVEALTTAYVQFEHPDGWRCELSQGVWICQSTIEPDRKESVVLSIATMATEWDSLDNYENYLKQPRTIQDEDGNTLTSKVTYTRRRNINGQNWIDSLQFNSELPGFWARYVATVHNKLAILITYIVSDEHYKKLAPQFERMVSSLKPNAEFDLNIASKQGEGPVPGAAKLGAVQKEILADRLNAKKLKDSLKKVDTKPAPPPGNKNGLLILIGTVAVALLVMMRMRRKKKVPQRPSSSGGGGPGPGGLEPRREPSREPTRPPTARNQR